MTSRTITRSSTPAWLHSTKCFWTVGAPLDIAVETIFTALEKEQFYILDSAKYERLLCEQGVFEAEKVRPVDFYTLN